MSDDKTYSAPEVALMLGISRNTLDKHLAEGRIPMPLPESGSAKRKHKRWRRTDIDKFLGIDEIATNDGALLSQVKAVTKDAMREVLREERLID